MQHPNFFHVEASVHFFKTILLLILACGAAQAQNFNATVVGQALDANGAAVVGAKVTITAPGAKRLRPRAPTAVTSFHNYRPASTNCVSKLMDSAARSLPGFS
jgi:hypothetical protein